MLYRPKWKMVSDNQMWLFAVWNACRRYKTTNPFYERKTQSEQWFTFSSTSFIFRSFICQLVLSHRSMRAELSVGKNELCSRPAIQIILSPICDGNSENVKIDTLCHYMNIELKIFNQQIMMRIEWPLVGKLSIDNWKWYPKWCHRQTNWKSNRLTWEEFFRFSRQRKRDSTNTVQRIFP